MKQRNLGVTVIEVERLGCPVLIVETTGPRLVLIDAALSCEERIAILKRFIPPRAA